MQIQMMQSQVGTEDGHTVCVFQKDALYDVSESLGVRFINSGHAIAITSEHAHVIQAANALRKAVSAMVGAHKARTMPHWLAVDKMTHVDLHLGVAKAHLMQGAR